MSEFWYYYKESLDNLSPTQCDFLIRDEYLFKCVKLCIPHTSLRDFLVWELHARDLTDILVKIKPLFCKDKFYWHSLKRDVVRIIFQCSICELGKSKK